MEEHREEQSHTLSVAPTRIVIGGEVHVVTPAAVPPSTPPEPHASPMRIFIHGHVVDRVAVDAAPDPGLLQLQQEQALRDNNMVEAHKRSYVDANGKTIYYTPDDRRQQQQIENAYAAREQWRREHGQDYIPTREAWARGEYGPPGKEE